MPGYKTTYLKVNLQDYSHVFAMDWSFSTDSEVTHKKRNTDKLVQKKIASDIKSLMEYFSQFKGKKLLVFEETTGSHWLYLNMERIFDRIIICDPYRNSLLKEGPKTDKIDSFKLLHLLMNNSIKEVYHTAKAPYELRKFMSVYEDLNKGIVRIKNQIAAMKRANGIRKNDLSFEPKNKTERFAYDQQMKLLAGYESCKQSYEQKMEELSRKYQIVRNLRGIPGIGTKVSLTIYSVVIDASRFADKYKYYAYSGLAVHPHESGKSISGRRKGRYNPRLKWAYKTAALAAIGGKNDIHDYYMYLLGKGYSEWNARNEIARYISRVSLAMMKNGTKYQAYSWRKAMN